jgi:hypothetical protein
MINKKPKLTRVVFKISEKPYRKQIKKIIKSNI